MSVKVKERKSGVWWTAGYSKNCLNNMRNLISGVMALAIEDKITEVNPAAGSGK